MLRIALIDLLLFLLPFLVYAAYMIAVKRTAPADIWKTAPILWLVAAGFGLLLVFMVTLVQFTGGSREGTYRPPVTVDGVIKPAEID
jgi:hypothetical protein